MWFMKRPETGSGLAVGFCSRRVWVHKASSGHWWAVFQHSRPWLWKEEHHNNKTKLLRRYYMMIVLRDQTCSTIKVTRHIPMCVIMEARKHLHSRSTLLSGSRHQRGTRWPVLYPPHPKRSQGSSDAGKGWRIHLTYENAQWQAEENITIRSWLEH